MDLVDLKRQYFMNIWGGFHNHSAASERYESQYVFIAPRIFILSRLMQLQGAKIKNNIG